MRWLLAGALLACCVHLLFFHRLGQRDLWNAHEARAALDAESLLTGPSWLLPRLPDGRWELQKPPGYYWAVAVLAWLRGGVVDAWSVRLPSTLSALATLLTLFWLARRPGQSILALYPTLILATALHFTWLARVGRIDMPLTAAITLALACFHRHRTGPGSFWLLLAGWLSLTVAVFLKGPIGLVLPGTVLACLCLLECRRPGIGLGWGLPLLGLLTLPWFLAANAITDGELWRVFFWHHNVERGLGGSRLRGHPWWYYGPQFLLDFLPWSPLVLLAIWHFARSGAWRDDPEARLGLAWLAGMVLVLSSARYKRADYLVPAYPGAALLAGAWMRRKELLPTLEGEPRASATGGMKASRERQRPEVFGEPGASATGDPWRAGSVSDRRRESPSLPSEQRGEKSCCAILALCALGWLLRVEVFLPRVEPRRELRSFAAAIRQQKPGTVVFFQAESHLLAFHLGRPLATVIDWPDLHARIDEAGVLHVVTRQEVAGQIGNLRNIETTRLLATPREHEKQLVFLRLRSRVATKDRGFPVSLSSRDHARVAGTACHCQGTAERRAAGP